MQRSCWHACTCRARIVYLLTNGLGLCFAFADDMTLARVPADALAGLGAYLLAPDRAVQHLLHALPWRPVLVQLAPLASPGICTCRVFKVAGNVSHACFSSLLRASSMTSNACS